ncbi:MAG: nucleotidyltransferase domain-containing protein [Anaerolineae bacterium]|nr:nucleotidyltransferase domain-containing protein [Anaerolineae bacterium]
MAPLPEQLEAFCQKYYIRKLALFGSVLREDFTNESDVDVLVEFEDGHTPDFFDFYTIEQELSGLSGGHAVDLVTQKALNRHLRDEIVRTVEVRFEQG